MAEHKTTCPKKTDANATCNCGAETPPPTTRKCWDCDADIGANEKKCPKCQADLELADGEDGVVEKSLKRLAKKNKAKKPTPQPGPNDPPKKKHPFGALSHLLNRKG